MGAAPLRERTNIDVVVVRATEGALERLRRDPAVVYVEPNTRVYAFRTPNDPFYKEQWNLQAIQTEQAWDITIGNPSVKVGVVDTGIAAHPDVLAISSGDGCDFVDGDGDPTDPGDPNEGGFSHGTAVASVIGAETNNNEGMAGVAWGRSGVSLVIARVLGADGSGNFADVAAGIVWAADRGAKVVNLSLGATEPGSCPQVVTDAVNNVVGRGVTVVAAAGNNGGQVVCPANLPNVVAVSATDNKNRVTGYSNRGPEIDVAAPGGDDTGRGCANRILVATPYRGKPDYVCVVGTSFAAPHVSGVAALMIANGITGPDTIKRKLQETALDIEEPGRDDKSGAGLIQADRAVVR